MFHQKIKEQTINQDIRVINHLSLDNQSYISPEVLFINKLFKKEKNGYYKIFVNINYNPNMVSAADFKLNKTLNNFDFKLYDQSLKEIKPMDTISKNIEINNLKHNKTFFEFQISETLFKNNEVKLNFGLSHQQKSIKYMNKGEIHLSSFIDKQKDSYHQNLASYYINYDANNQVIIGESIVILKGETELKFNQFEVNKKYTNLASLNTVYTENYDFIKNTPHIISQIDDIKNDAVFNNYEVLETNVVYSSTDAKYYKGEYKSSYDKKTGKLKSEIDSKIIKKSKQVINEPLEKGNMIFNPYSFDADQKITFKISIFGTIVNIKKRISSYFKYTFVNKGSFELKKPKIYEYKFDAYFWKVILLLNDEEIIAGLKKYEKI